jgi:LPS-assembly lipoprotein
MKRAAALILMIILTGCGLRPLYGGGSTGQAATILGKVDVQLIQGKAGWLVRNALNDRLGAVKQDSPTYRLEVELDDQITGFGVRRSSEVTRERRSLRARYRLVDASGTIVIDATAGSDAGIDAVSSEYATVAAENTALERLAQTVADQIVTRLATYAQSSKAQAAIAGAPRP